MKHLEAGPFECANRRLVNLESDRRALVGIRKAIAILDVDAGVIERVEHAGEAARNIRHFDGDDLREVGRESSFGNGLRPHPSGHRR